MTPAIEGRGLVKRYPARRHAGGDWNFWRRSEMTALSGVSVSIQPGETLALVGESGSGKSTLGRLLAMMEDPDGGEIRFGGREQRGFSGAEHRALRRSVQVVFQDPYESLDPRFTVREIIEEPLVALRLSKDEKRSRLLEALASVELSPAERYLDLRPHQLSGGQRQRIAIARAIVLKPKVLIADEPTSMLDVSLRIGILRLLEDVRDRHGIAILLITHDLAIARFAAERIMVMYAGRIVESGPTETVLRTPNHPYTRLLLAAAPRLRPGRRRIRAGERRSASEGGCAFAPRCALCIDECLRVSPDLAPVAPDHLSACLVSSKQPVAVSSSDRTPQT